MRPIDGDVERAADARAAVLGEWLQRYRAASAAEEAHRRRMLALLDAASGDATRRDHFRPGHFTASAFVLAPDAEALLLVHHRKLDLWLQPGGHIDPSDANVLAAARRELAEETGLVDLPLLWPGVFDVDVHEIPPRAREPQHVHFDVRFLFQAHDRSAVRPSTEVRGAHWVSLRESARGSDESVARVSRKLGG